VKGLGCVADGDHFWGKWDCKVELLGFGNF
jgi:hypothetical protein